MLTWPVDRQRQQPTQENKRLDSVPSFSFLLLLQPLKLATMGQVEQLQLSQPFFIGSQPRRTFTNRQANKATKRPFPTQCPPS